MHPNYSMEEDASGPAGVAQSASSDAETVSLDAIFDILTDQRRRYTLHCLEKYENPMTLADLADEIAVWENETEIANIPAEDVKYVYTSLYHTHIPKMADAGIVEYDQEQDMVSLGENADQLREHLESFTE